MRKTSTIIKLFLVLALVLSFLNISKINAFSKNNLDETLFNDESTSVNLKERENKALKENALDIFKNLNTNASLKVMYRLINMDNDVRYQVVELGVNFGLPDLALETYEELKTLGKDVKFGVKVMYKDLKYDLDFREIKHDGSIISTKNILLDLDGLYRSLMYQAYVSVDGIITNTKMFSQIPQEMIHTYLSSEDLVISSGARKALETLCRHDLNITYTLNEDSSKMTAKAVCGICGKEIVETVNTKVIAFRDSTCLKTGFKRISANFLNACFKEQERTIEIPLKEHNYTDIKYVWSPDHLSLTAYMTCSNNHTDEEKAEVVVSLVKDATCTEDGLRLYTPTFKNPILKAEAYEEVIPMLNHDWDLPIYVWNDDHTQVQATRICKNDKTHIEREIGDVSETIIFAATCDMPGQKSCAVTFKNPGFVLPISIFEIPALGHDYNYNYKWSSDHLSLTAFRVCSHDKQHQDADRAYVSFEITKAPTCTEAGSKTYTGTFNYDFFETQTFVEEIPMLNHDYKYTYKWSTDHSSLKALRVCQNDNKHQDLEEASVSVEIIKPTCLVAGKKVYTGTFKNSFFETQTYEETINPLGHNYKYTYTWSNDHLKGTAKRVCLNDETHHDEEEVNSVVEVTKAPTCTEAGVRTYTLTFTNSYFETQTFEEAINPLGHNYKYTYTWSPDHLSVTAKRVCLNDEKHHDEEEATSVLEVTKAPTCTEAGLRTYTATFINTYFEVQTFEEAINATGHDYKYTYNWSENHLSLTANRVCLNDENHHDEVKATVKVEVTNPTCEVEGTKVYTATFINSDFETQTYEEKIPSIGHNYKYTYNWSEDHLSLTANRVCLNDENHHNEEEATINVKVTDPTCLLAGKKVYTATFTNSYFETQTFEEVLPKLGHNYTDIKISYVHLNQEATAFYRCDRCNESFEETVTYTSSIINRYPETFTCDLQVKMKFAFGEKVEVLENVGLDDLPQLPGQEGLVGYYLELGLETIKLNEDVNNPGVYKTPLINVKAGQQLYFSLDGKALKTLALKDSSNNLTQVLQIKNNAENIQISLELNEETGLYEAFAEGYVAVYNLNIMREPQKTITLIRNLEVKDYELEYSINNISLKRGEIINFTLGSDILAVVLDDNHNNVKLVDNNITVYFDNDNATIKLHLKNNVWSVFVTGNNVESYMVTDNISGTENVTKMQEVTGEKGHWQTYYSPNRAADTVIINFNGLNITEKGKERLPENEHFGRSTEYVFPDVSSQHKGNPTSYLHTYYLWEVNVYEIDNSIELEYSGVAQQTQVIEIPYVFDTNDCYVAVEVVGGKLDGTLYYYDFELLKKINYGNASQISEDKRYQPIFFNTEYSDKFRLVLFLNNGTRVETGPELTLNPRSGNVFSRPIDNYGENSHAVSFGEFTVDPVSPYYEQDRFTYWFNWTARKQAPFGTANVA